MKTIIVCAITMCASFAALSQDTKSTVTDDELMKYATVMDSVAEMSASAKLELADKVKNDTVMTGARYNELSKIINDPAKLAEASATPEEIAYLKEVAAKKEQETVRINATYQSLAKEYVTVPVFNKVKKALASDPLLKERYDALMLELSKDNPAIQQ
jgi:hypothetical protein